MSQASTKQFVAVLDFGAQYGQLIARRVRDLNVYSEIVPCDISADELREMAPSALILSGGPASVYAEDAPRVDPAIFELGVPVLTASQLSRASERNDAPRLSDLRESEHLFLLRRSQQQRFFIAKDGFTAGTADEFRKFISERIPTQTKK